MALDVFYKLKRFLLRVYCIHSSRTLRFRDIHLLGEVIDEKSHIYTCLCLHFLKMCIISNFVYFSRKKRAGSYFTLFLFFLLDSYTIPSSNHILTFYHDLLQLGRPEYSLMALLPARVMSTRSVSLPWNLLPCVVPYSSRGRSFPALLHLQKSSWYHPGC